MRCVAHFQDLVPLATPNDVHPAAAPGTGPARVKAVRSHGSGERRIAFEAAGAPRAGDVFHQMTDIRQAIPRKRFKIPSTSGMPVDPRNSTRCEVSVARRPYEVVPPGSAGELSES